MENKKWFCSLPMHKLSRMDAVRKMAGGAAHDINNILTGILGFTALMMSEIKEDDPLYCYCKEIEKNGNDAKAFSDKLIRLSRHEEPKKSAVELRALAEEAIGTLKERFSGRIEAVLPEGLPPIQADREGLLAVLELIFSRILQIIPESGSVSVSVNILAGAPRSVVIDVGCEGLRVDNSRLPFIFEPAYSCYRDELLGYELAVAAEIVAAHGGTIKAEAFGEGKGVIFRIELPS